MVNKRIFRKENAPVFTAGMVRAWKVITFISVFCLSLALIVGCGESDLEDDLEDTDSIVDTLPDLDDLEVREQILAEALDEDNLLSRPSASGEELHYAPNQQEPYTGWIKLTEDDEPFALYQVQDGKKHGLYLEWHSNQQNKVKGFYKDGVAPGLWTFWSENGEKHYGLYHGHGDVVDEVAFSPDGNTLASAGRDRTIRLWDMETGTHKKLIGHTEWIWSVVFSPDGNILASGSSDDTIRLWDVETGTLLYTLTGHTSGVISTVFSPDGNTLTSISHDRTLRLWDVRKGTHIRTITAPAGGVLSPDKKTIANVSVDDTIRLWDVETGTYKELIRYRGWGGVVLVFSPDGKILASSAGGDDDTIRLWDVETGTLLHILTGHTSGIGSVAFSPDGNTLASGSADGPIRLWDVRNATHLRTLIGHTDWVSSVAFSPDENTLASASVDDTIRLWDVP